MGRAGLAAAEMVLLGDAPTSMRSVVAAIFSPARMGFEIDSISDCAIEFCI
jgi:hypothetical protein